jgi:uncharacterized Tic20 family protein
MSESLPPSAPAVGAPLPPDQERTWAGFAHLGGILGFLPSLIIWLVYKDRSALVGSEARKALNFMIGATIAWIAIYVVDLMFLPYPLGSLLNLAVWVVVVIFSIQGFQSAQKSQPYTYPFSLDLVK